MGTFHQTLDNAVFLFLLGVSYYQVEIYRHRIGSLGAQCLHGLGFGFVAFLVTSTPVTLADGATLDARAGPVILASVFGGPVAGLIAAAMGALARGVVGGSFAPSGMVVFFVYALSGIALRYFRVVSDRTAAAPRGMAILTVATFAGAGAMFFVIRPLERAQTWAANDLPYILVANAVSVCLSAFILGVALMILRRNREVIDLAQRLELAQRAGRFGIWDFDVRTGRLTWDDRSCDMHGIDPATFRGTFEDWASQVHPDDLPAARAAFEEALAGKSEYSQEYRVRIDGQTDRTIQGDAVVVRDGAGAPIRVVGTNLDLSELRLAQADLIEAQAVAAQAQKAETLGKLTGGVAHDFNNLLAVILGNQELLRDEIRKAPVNVESATGLIDASIEATQRGADLTRNMLAYARKAQLTPVVADLNEIILETDRWLRRTIESSVEIETALQAGLWPALVDRASMQSALVNLLLNARDALEGRGRVTVETSNVRVDEAYVEERGEDIAPGRYVLIAVTDTGPGIPAEIRGQVFDPFFTTKPTGKGSGLGLSMVEGFVKQSQGAIRVYSEPGVGTCFKLYFPAALDAATAGTRASPVVPLPATGITGLGRIFLVEDDGKVLTVMERTLTGAGYSVVTAQSGDAALAVFRDDRRFDVIVTDIVMPGRLQGPALARAIREIAPDAKFVFLSGYASEATVHGNGLRPEDIRLMKPVSRADLLRAVRTAIGNGNGNGT